MEKPDVEDVKEGSPGDRLRGVKVANCCSVFFPRFVMLYLPCFGYSQLCISSYFLFFVRPRGANITKDFLGASRWWRLRMGVLTPHVRMGKGSSDLWDVTSSSSSSSSSGTPPSSQTTPGSCTSLNVARLPGKQTRKCSV